MVGSEGSRTALQAVAATVAVVLLVACGLAGVPAKAVVAGQPGVPQAPVSLYTEDFSAENASGAAIDIIDYQGAPGTTYNPGVSGASSETYDADFNWQGRGNFCNGWIVNSSTPTPPFWPGNCSLAAVRTLAQRLGQFQGMTPSAALANQAVTAYTGGNPGPGVQLFTKTPIPAVAGHFYQVGALFGEANCPNGATTALERFTLLVDGARNVIGNNLVPCTDPSRVDYGGGTVVAPLKSGVIHLAPGGTPGLQLEIYNAQGSGGGNDVAFDLPQILDVTPQLDKAFSPGIIAAGGVATITYTITNTLELAAKNGWAFTDDLPAGMTATGSNSSTCSGATVTAVTGAHAASVSGNLNAGQSSCSVSVQVAVSASGSYVNGPGNFSVLNGLYPPADAQLLAQPPASLVVTKESSTSAITAVGQKVTYKYLVENRGTTPVTGITIDDVPSPPALPASLSPISCPVSALEPHASTTCVATYTVTQADIDHGSLSDTARVTGTGPNGAVTSPPSSLTISGPAPAISVAKTTSTTLVSAVGQQIPYQFTVRNTGNVQLFGITVTDTQNPPASPGGMSVVSCPQPSLAPGDSQVCTGTYTAAQPDLVNGSIQDSAIAYATDVSGQAVNSAPATLSVPSTLPGSLEITKTSTATTLPAVGGQIPYTFTVHNTSTMTVNNIQVIDTQSPPALPGNMSAITCAATSLASGASTTCTGTYTVTLADRNSGQVSDSAVAQGTDPAANSVLSSPATLAITLPVSSLAVVKSTTVTAIAAVGQRVPYTFTVTNTGNQTLTAISVSDTQTPPASQTSMSAVTCPSPSLAPGASEICTGTYTVGSADLANGSLNDTAVATGRDPSNSAVFSPQSSASVPVASAPLTLVKSSSTDSIIRAGQLIQYAFTVSNNSDVAYSSIQVDDVQTPPATQGNLSAISCPQPTLQPHQSESCTATYLVTEADVQNGSVSDVATASGHDPEGAIFTTAPSSAIIPLNPEPAISVLKSTTTPRITAVGQSVDYRFTVTNTGNTALTGLQIDDVLTPPATPGGLSPIRCPDTALPVGGQTVCTATYAVTQKDLDAGSLGDTATATAIAPSGQSVTSRPSRVTITTVPRLTITKTSPNASFSRAGEVVPFTFAVTNVGVVAATNVSVTDLEREPATQGNLTPVICADSGLAPGASTTCTASYTVTQADIENGTLEDTAQAFASEPDGFRAPPSEPVTLSIPAASSPELTVVKSSSTSVLTSVGQIVQFAYRVTNIGNRVLGGIGVTDAVTPPGSQGALSPVSCLQPTLAPGAFEICTGTYTVTQADLDAGGLTDTATVAARDGSGAPVVSSPSSVTIPAPATRPAITVVKSSATSTVTRLFDQVGYRYLVTNTGTVTLTSVRVTDTQTPPATQANLSPVQCPATSLAPGASMSCTATYTATQPDMDAGIVADSATAQGVTPGSVTVVSTPSQVQIPVSPVVSGLSLVKTAQAASVTALGQQVPYTFAVTNTGNQTVTGLTVNDTVITPSLQSNLSAITCPTTTIAPAATVTCTGTYTTTLADLNNGRIDDSASALGMTPAGAPVSSTPDDASVRVTAQSGLAVVKSSTTTAITAAGQVVPYTFTATNTGNQTLTGLTVADQVTPPADPGRLSAVTCPTTTMTPGQTVTCTADYTVTQADLDHGSLADTATASATTPNGPVTSPSDILNIPATASPTIAIVKSTATTAALSPGQVVPYVFTVTNTGNQTLTAITVTDTVLPPSLPDDLSAVTCPTGPVAPGGSVGCTADYTVSQADLDAGSVADTATARGTPPAGTAVTSTPSAVAIPVTAQPALTLVKTSATTAITAVGEVVPYRFTVTNTGNQTLTGVAVADAVTPPATAANLSPAACPPGPLAPGAQRVCTATYTVTQADIDHGSVADTATASATAPGNLPVASAGAGLAIPVTASPSIAMVKRSSTSAVTVAGQVVPYVFSVTNTGDQTLTGITVTDTVLPPSLPGDLSAISCPASPLAPGATVDCTADYTVSQADLDSGSVGDTATATATSPAGRTVTSSPSAVAVPVTPQPGLTVVKNTTTTAITAAGQVVPYTFTVTNTGNQSVTAVTVTDAVTAPADASRLSPVTCPGASLSPGARAVCTGTYTTTQADLDHGSIADTAAASARTPGNVPVTSATDTLTTPVAAAPALSVVKSSTTSAVHSAGELVPYVFTVTNTGNQTVTGITVDDVVAPPASPGDLGPVSCAQTALAPGSALTCTAEYTASQADVDSGAITDTATAHGVAPGGAAVTSPDDTLSVPVDQVSALALVKSVALSGQGPPLFAGEIATYTFVVTNTGNTTLTAPAVAETAFTGAGPTPVATCPAGAVPPGAQVFCTATYTISQADVDAGTVSNTAEATATGPGGTVTSAPSSAAVPFTPAPALALTKAVTPQTVARPGESVHYLLVVTNTGNTTLTGIGTTEVSFTGSSALPAPVCAAPTLAPGQFTRCTTDYTVSQSDLDAGTVTNTATATGSAPGGAAVVSAPSTAVFATQALPGLTLSKSVSPATAERAGDILRYSYALTNTGNVALADPAIVETAFTGTGTLGALECPPSIPVGSSVTCTRSYQLTQADVNAGTVSNTATAHATALGSPVGSVPATATVSIPALPGLGITVTNDAAGKNPGDTITYTFTVTDAGNLTLTDPGVTIGTFTGSGARPVVVCPAAPLQPGESMVCTATYIITDDDAAAGSITLTATAHARTPGGSPVVTLPASLTSLVTAPAPPQAEKGSPPPANTLPATGTTPSGALALAAMSALLLGTALVVHHRRRRPRQTRRP